ncbi:MAG TPA: SPOR domain-containing protein [Casimicrobiaceae bacterium]|jgi:DedD protein|nr:SPOR domain-containing protein [Casimicrobiaceae bacterium]
MAEPADINVDELRRRARRRLVGAVVLALGVAVVVPMLLETEQKPLGEDVSVKIPPIDDGKFVNRLSENRAKDGATTPVKPPARDESTKEPPAAAAPVVAPSAAPVVSPSAPPKYDTRIPDTPVTTAPTPEKTTAVPAARSPTSTPDATKAVRTDTKSTVPATPPAPPPVAAPSPKAASSGEASAPPHDGFAVQLAAFADDKGANALAGRLKKSGYAAYTEPLKTSKGTLWRVRVGPYPSREAAVAARDKLKTEGQSGIVAAVK